MVNTGGRAAVLCTILPVLLKRCRPLCVVRERERSAASSAKLTGFSRTTKRKKKNALCAPAAITVSTYVVIALGLAVYVPLYILCCGLCNFTIFLVEKGREKRREAKERVTSDRQQKQDAEEKESTVGEKDTVQSVCLEIEEGETTVHVMM